MPHSHIGTSPLVGKEPQGFPGYLRKETLHVRFLHISYVLIKVYFIGFQLSLLTARARCWSDGQLLSIMIVISLFREAPFLQLPLV